VLLCSALIGYIAGHQKTYSRSKTVLWEVPQKPSMYSSLNVRDQVADKDAVK
jgi:hypothetical protein